MGPHPPFPRSYWVYPTLVIAGCYPGSKSRREANEKLSGLAAAGVTLVVNLMDPYETGWDGQPFVPYEAALDELIRARDRCVTFVRVPIADTTAPSRRTMAWILDIIDRATQSGEPAFVHCWGGRGRTGTVVGCYLARHGIATGSAALAYIAALRANDPTAAQPSPETPEQIALVTSWRVHE